MSIKKLTAESKSFIILFLIAIFGALLCMYLWGTLPSYKDLEANDVKNSPSQTSNPATNSPALPPVDTSDWKNYSNSKYGISFSYDPTWKVLAPKTENGFQVIEIDPGKKFYNIKIYISQQGYYVFDGLPSVTTTIGGQPAQDVNDMLYAVKDNQFYYTFDVGYSTTLQNKFDALVKTVQFQ